jgi:hypothetical protein
MGSHDRAWHDGERTMAVQTFRIIWNGEVHVKLARSIFFQGATYNWAAGSTWAKLNSPRRRVAPLR